MALQAQYVDVTHLEQVRIGRAMRRMAHLAALDLHNLVFKDEWALLVRVALEADRVLCGRDTQLMWLRCAVGVMAIRTLNQAFVHAMVEWHLELRFLLQMAGVTKFRLSLDEQELRAAGVMDGMTGCARHIVLGVQRINRLHVFCA